MPIYQYECNKCGRSIERYRNISECDDPVVCLICNSNAKRVFSVHNVRAFNAQIVGATLTGKDGEDINQYVRNRQELTDAINRYNDTERASKTGKLAILEQLQRREL